jgi:hypothetical protein
VLDLGADFPDRGGRVVALGDLGLHGEAFGERLAAAGGAFEEGPELGDELGAVEAAPLAPGAVFVEPLDLALEFGERALVLVGGGFDGFGGVGDLSGAVDGLGLLGAEQAEFFSQAFLPLDQRLEGRFEIAGEINETLDLEPGFRGQDGDQILRPWVTTAARPFPRRARTRGTPDL